MLSVRALHCAFGSHALLIVIIRAIRTIDRFLRCSCRGVSWHSQTGRWKAQIKVSGRDINLGRHRCRYDFQSCNISAIECKIAFDAPMVAQIRGANRQRCCSTCARRE